MTMPMPITTSETDDRNGRAVEAGPLPRRGTVLLFSLIVMSSVVIASAGLGSLILSSLQQTRTIDASMIAYYAAESGIEDALFVARRTSLLPSSVPVPIALGNGAEWTRAVSGTEDILYLTVPADTLAEVALYDPDDPTVATGIAAVDIDWTDSCGGCTTLQASLVGWSPGGPIAWDPSPATFNFSGGSASLSVGSPVRLYKLRLLAKNADLEAVRIRAYDSGGAPLPLPGRVRIEGTGEFVGVRQRLTVTLPREVPLSGIFEFVIFSECSLVKGGPISCP